MKLISHRGNINGRFESFENEPTYIDSAISKGYDVEIDIWHKDDVLWLGHDKPDYRIDFRFIKDRITKLWVHCKNIEAVLYLKECGYDVNYFWHQEDDITLTSKGYLWTYPGKKLTKFSIAVMPEYKSFDNIEISYGICSDYIDSFRSSLLSPISN
jgi:hypothetical protein